jgi:hypothetical protein
MNDKKNCIVMVGGPFDGFEMNPPLPVSKVAFYTDNALPDKPKKQKPNSFIFHGGFIAVYDEGSMHQWGSGPNSETGEYEDNTDELKEHLKSGWPLLFNKEESGIDNEPIED